MLEFSYRFYLFGWSCFSIERTNSINSLGISGLLQKSAHPELGWELKPNLDTYFKLTHFQTNSRGLRDTEHSFKKPDNTYRIAVVGDSFSLPSGVDIDDSYHQVIERLLNTEDQDREFEVINFSVGGYSLNQYLGLIQFRAAAYDPDMILVGFCPENDERVPRYLENVPYIEKEQTYPFYDSFILNLLKPALMRNQKAHQTQKEFSDRQTTYLKSVFSQMGSFSKTNNIPVIIVFLSTRNSEFRRSYSSGLEEIVTQCGLQYADVSQAFQGENDRKFWIFPTDYHPNKEANLKFAQYLYGFIREKII